MSNEKHSTGMQVFYAGLIGLVVLLLAYGGISFWVQSELDTICAKARQKYPGDNVDALIVYLNSENLKSKEIHRVIWALGELRNKRALTTLKALLPNEHINQYELQKAIKKIEGETPNPYFWRKILSSSSSN
jgi:hypothetical protein